MDSLAAITLRENAGGARLLQAAGFSPTPGAGIYSEHALRLGRR